jgi:CubicO group peptidase (beta-lactamase class C family)
VWCVALLAGMILFSSCGPSYTRAKYETNSYEWEETPALSRKEETLVFRIDTFFRHKVRASGLNGSVLVANEGKVLYQKSFGYADYRKKIALTDSATFQIASASKPFTATAILMLQERGRLDINDPVSKYIKGFPYDSIKVKMLLNHRSGLANYIYLFDTLKLGSDTFVTNKDVVDYFLRNKPALQATPGHKFQYCNSNYALLAYIIERVSHKSYGDFILENIFLPSHMYHSRVRNVFDSAVDLNQVIAYAGSKWEEVGAVPYDGVVGDKGIYTNAHDLYLFDQALNHGLLLNDEMLKEAYQGYSYEKPGQKNYGLGWRMKELPDSSKIIYHNGWWRGFNTLFVRRPEKGICIIILSNKYNRNVYDVKGLYDLLDLADGSTEGEE